MHTSSTTLQFQANWHEILSGELTRGGPLRIDYDGQRLPNCRLNYRGAPLWDILLYLQFHPGEEFYHASLTEGTTATPGGMIVERHVVPFELTVPSDATQVELWFQNKDTYYSYCSAWDSRYGQNYRFAVGGAPTRWRENVAYRLGALVDPSMVNVIGERVEKRNVFPQPATGPRAGKDLQLFLTVSAWVRNVAYQKNVWIDLHLFDDQDNVVDRQTQTLRWQLPSFAGDDFQFDAQVYQGLKATPGSVSPRPDVRKLQYRLYYEASGAVYTDGIAHEFQLLPDAVVN